MRFVDEYRDPQAVQAFAKRIRGLVTKPWTIMEVCGGQTHSIVRFGIDQLLPDRITLVHGPGCPVCVTPLELIEKAITIARRPEVIFCSFGDMLRVPGETVDLLTVKSEGGDVRILYSPLDALKVAEENPDREVVFFAVGFETTAPAHAILVKQASQRGLRNLSILVSHVLVPPAIDAVLSAPDSRVNAFLAAGHVCTVMGWDEYLPITQKYTVPIVVTGFEPLDLLEGIYLCVKQLEEGRGEVENQYSRSVRPHGNRAAQVLIREIFTVVPRKWRGVGEISNSGLGLSDEYFHFDAEKRFDLADRSIDENPKCISGNILRGVSKPPDCSAFGVECTPEHPLGATMVSSEGACSAYYRYRRVSHE